MTQQRGWVIDSSRGAHVPLIAAPGGPFHVKVTVAPPFQPATVDPSNLKVRYFGAQLGLALRTARELIIVG